MHGLYGLRSVLDQLSAFEKIRGKNEIMCFRRKLYLERRNIYGIFFSRGRISLLRAVCGRAHLRHATAPWIQGFITDMMRRLSKIEVASSYDFPSETEDGKRWAWVPRFPAFRSRCLAPVNYGACIAAWKTHTCISIFLFTW